MVVLREVKGGSGISRSGAMGARGRTFERYLVFEDGYERGGAGIFLARTFGFGGRWSVGWGGSWKESWRGAGGRRRKS